MKEIEKTLDDNKKLLEARRKMLEMLSIKNDETLNQAVEKIGNAESKLKAVNK